LILYRFFLYRLGEDVKGVTCREDVFDLHEESVTSQRLLALSSLVKGLCVVGTGMIKNCPDFRSNSMTFFLPEE
jgi:hypothetical protein